jgi:hypothetical protein
LRRWNVALTLLHAAQAVAMLVLGTDFAITITASFPAGPPGSAPPPPKLCSTCLSRSPSPCSWA